MNAEEIINTVDPTLKKCNFTRCVGWVPLTTNICATCGREQSRFIYGRYIPIVTNVISLTEVKCVS